MTKKRRLLWFGHVERMEGERLAIAALHGHDRGGKEKQETKEDPDGQCQERPEGEKHRLDHDWRGDQKQRGLEKSCKSLIVSSLREERKEEDLPHSPWTSKIWPTNK